MTTLISDHPLYVEVGDEPGAHLRRPLNAAKKPRWLWSFC
jgi:hypothetical protein